MSDPEATIREALEWARDYDRHDNGEIFADAFASLAALVAERDEARRLLDEIAAEHRNPRAAAAERENAELREALQETLVLLVEARDEISRVAFDKVSVSDSIWRAIDRARAALPRVPASPKTVECPDCEGDGWYTAAEHDPRCDGSCDFCPVPVQRECQTCGGSGRVPGGVQTPEETTRIEKLDELTRLSQNLPGGYR